MIDTRIAVRGNCVRISSEKMSFPESLASRQISALRPDTRAQDRVERRGEPRHPSLLFRAERLIVNVRVADEEMPIEGRLPAHERCIVHNPDERDQMASARLSS
jgi:hypothetical protein